VLGSARGLLDEPAVHSNVTKVQEAKQMARVASTRERSWVVEDRLGEVGRQAYQEVESLVHLGEVACLEVA
jgi:hypothetical protein